MPRNGSGVASPPPGTNATPNTTIQSTPYNAFVADIYGLQNEQRPITAGGTGSGTAIGGHDNLSSRGSAIASAATTDIWAASGDLVHITGNAAITSFGSTATAGWERTLVFDGAATLTHNATSLILPSGANIVAAAGDTAIVRSEGGANSRVVSFTRASGQPIIVPTPGAAKTDSRRNRIVNHDMRVSQENGTTSGTTSGFYAADQWATYRVTSAGVITSAQVASVTPAGSPNRYRVTITTPDTSLAAGEYLSISQNLEGSNVADFQYGGANAKQSVLRFGFRGPAGTYSIALHNSAVNRSYVALFAISAPQANTDTVQSFAIPGDVTGTWLTADGVIGITLDIVLAAGTTYQAATGWQSGNILATSAVSNGMATGGAVFELFDVGLRLDPDATGVYGQYEVGEVQPVYRSERYFLSVVRSLGLAITNNIASGGVVPLDMCKAPALAPGATFTVGAGAVGTVAILSLASSPVNSKAVHIYNQLNNWNTQTTVSVSAFISARI